MSADGDAALVVFPFPVSLSRARFKRRLPRVYRRPQSFAGKLSLHNPRAANIIIAKAEKRRISMKRAPRYVNVCTISFRSIRTSADSFVGRNNSDGLLIESARALEFRNLASVYKWIYRQVNSLCNCLGEGKLMGFVSVIFKM